jgi:hypothetical protein
MSLPCCLTELEKNAAVTGRHALDNQALTGSTKERKVLKTHRGEFLLFPDCSREN